MRTLFPLKLYLYILTLSRQHFLYIFVLLISIYYNCLGNLISEKEWQTRYLPRVLVIALFAFLVVAFISKDLEVMFLEVLPSIMNLGILAVLGVDIFKTLRGGDVKG
jgi:hypothetical protein